MAVLNTSASTSLIITDACVDTLIICLMNILIYFAILTIVDDGVVRIRKGTRYYGNSFFIGTFRSSVAAGVGLL